MKCVTENKERNWFSMKTEVKEIPFNGSTLLGVRDAGGQVWLAIRKVCSDIGLSDGQTRRQLENLKDDLVFSKGITNLRYPSNGGEQETTCIQEKFVTLWLAKISLTPTMQKKNPEAVEKLLKYQLEAADVLHKAFYETEEQKSTLNTKMGLEGEIADFKEQLKMAVVQLNNVEETLDFQNEKLDAVMDNMTLTTVQQGRLQRSVKDRVSHLLGGAHSSEYKEYSRMYFINIWNGLKEQFQCGSHWQDLNPKYFNQAFDFISEWEYAEM